MRLRPNRRIRCPTQLRSSCRFGDYINHLAGVAVDTVGNVYVLDYYYGQAWKLAAGTNTLTKPFTDLGQSTEVAVDTGGHLYVLDDNSFRVLKLAAQ